MFPGDALALAHLDFDLVINYVSNLAAAQQTCRDCVMSAGSMGKTIRVELCQADISSATDRERLIGEKYLRLWGLVRDV